MRLLDGAKIQLLLIAWSLLLVLVPTYAFSVTTAKTVNSPVLGTNQMFEFLKWGGSTPDFDVLEKTKEYTSLLTYPDASWYHKDYVLRGVVIGPINLKDLQETQSGFNLTSAFPDIRRDSFGFTVDPENPYRCFYFQRWRATHTGTLTIGGQTYEATYNSMETPVSVFSVVWTPEENIIYEQVGAVVDRFEGNTEGKAAIFGLLHTAGIKLPGSPGSPLLRVLQRLGHLLGNGGRSFSREDEIPSWWTSRSRGADPSDN